VLYRFQLKHQTLGPFESKEWNFTMRRRTGIFTKSEPEQGSFFINIYVLLGCLIDEKDEFAVSLIIGENGHDTRKVDELSLLLV
jgi:hypothetical protein